MPTQRKKTKPKTKAQKKPASKKSTLKRRTRRGKKKSSVKKNIFVVLGVLLLISMVAFGYFLGNNNSSAKNKTLHSKTSIKDNYSTKELLNDLSNIVATEPKVIKKEKSSVKSVETKTVAKKVRKEEAKKRVEKKKQKQQTKKLALS